MQQVHQLARPNWHDLDEWLTIHVDLDEDKFRGAWPSVVLGAAEAEWLRAAGYGVRTADGGDAGLVCVKNSAPAVISRKSFKISPLASSTDRKPSSAPLTCGVHFRRRA